MSRSISALALAALGIFFAAPALAQQKAAPSPYEATVVPGVTKGQAIARQPLGIGRAATKEEVAAWDIDVRADGAGLPPGKGSVKEGEKVYLEKCASCHGEFGEGAGRWPYLMGRGKLTDEDPKKSVGSYWPWAPTLFDYVKRAMPYGDAQSLTDDQVYAVTAYLLHVNDLLPADAVLDARSLAAIKMPNRDGFVADVRPDTKRGEPCMKNCKDAVKIHSEARKVDVTPKDTRDPAKGRRVD
jgi:cytochrome c